jgi:transposase
VSCRRHASTPWPPTDARHARDGPASQRRPIPCKSRITVAAWVRLFCCDGIKGTSRKKPTGRPPKLTPTQKAALAILIDEGPVKAGFSGACWRSPMIQQLIYDRFGLFSNVFYIAQLLKNLG